MFSSLAFPSPRLWQGFQKDTEKMRRINILITHCCLLYHRVPVAPARRASQASVICSFNHSQPHGLTLHLLQNQMPSSQTRGFFSSWQLVSPEVCMTCLHPVVMCRHFSWDESWGFQLIYSNPENGRQAPLAGA